MLGWDREEDLSATLVTWLRDLGWEVYQEVSPKNTDSIADIIAVKKPLVWILETKLAMSPELLWQATKWEQWAHYVSVAVPHMGVGREREHFFERYCRQNGIGLLVPSTYDMKEYEFHEKVPPRLVRRPGFVDNVTSMLTERHKDYARAGNAKGLRYTPWRATCEKVREAVERRPGLTLKECIEDVEHHYRSSTTARTSMAHWIKKGKVEGVEILLEGRTLHLYPSKNGKRKHERPVK